MVVFCAYCGKSFTRKEHLERHIPSHTNVKPHRCSACQLSFARRDLLQRHHSTYHEAQPIEPPKDGVPTIGGKTPIACLNCAQAKTGCDKRVPCARCTDKNLPCAARFARRSSKAAIRAAQASASISTTAILPQQTTTSPVTVDPALMEIDSEGGKEAKRPSGVTTKTAGTTTTATTTPLMTVSSSIVAVPSPDTKTALNTRSESRHSCRKNTPLLISQPSPEGFPSPHTRVEGLDDFMHLSNDFMPPSANYQDMLIWQDYPFTFDTFPHMSIAQQDPSIPAFTALSDVSSNSERRSSARTSIHTRSTSVMSNGEHETSMKALEGPMLSPVEPPEFEAVIAAEAAWPLARCNPPIYSDTCPRTAIVHLESLEQRSKHEGTWDVLEVYLQQVDWDATDLASVVPISSQTRDKMLAITQSFLFKALEIHRGGVNGYHKAGYSSPGLLPFLVLPPSKILEYFLRSYVRSLSFFFPLISTGCVDPNEMIQDNRASTLLVLLMIAQGASAVPTAEARALSAGLIETCRISLFDIIEKDIELCADPIALRCALLFTLLGSWSGDKWLMDIAMGQRGMYLSMLRHAGMFAPRASMVPSIQGPDSTELQWRAWLLRETQNRLVYNWVMVDQELSLFHDTAPMLAVSDLHAPLPGPELLWMSANSEQWSAGMQSIYGRSVKLNPELLNNPSIHPSLYDLHQDFLHDNLSRRQADLTAQQLRLLLHPLQSLLCHLRQLLSCFSDLHSTRRTTSRTVTKSSTMLRLEEVQALLQKWYELSIGYQKANPNCLVNKTNLVLYHLISLNAVTSFPEIERLARRDGFDGSYWELSLRHKRCIFQREEAVFHCGQVLRLIRGLPTDRRPAWWSVAVYRASLILWIDCMSRLDPNFQKNSDFGDSVAIDQVTPEDAAVIAYLWSGEGVPVLTSMDGTQVSLEKPTEVLGYAIRTIDDGISSRLGDGIKRKLVALNSNWNMSELITTVV